jgi:hypothetical protein
MSFQALVPLGGLAGWSYLKRTVDTQTALLARQPVAQRDEAYFRENIRSIDTAEELVADRRLLTVALGAFGLESEVNNRAFLRKVLEEGTLRPESLSNRLSDKRFRDFSAAFGFGDFSIPRNKLSDFADQLIPQNRARQFEASVGRQSDTMRLALNAQRELAALSRRNLSDDAMWFTIMGNKPLRDVMDKALGLPSSFATLPIDQQVQTWKDLAGRRLNVTTPRDFARPEVLEATLRQFVIRADAAITTPTTRGFGALQLLQLRL